MTPETGDAAPPAAQETGPGEGVTFRVHPSLVSPPETSAPERGESGKPSSDAPSKRGITVLAGTLGKGPAGPLGSVGERDPTHTLAQCLYHKTPPCVPGAWASVTHRLPWRAAAKDIL